MCLHRPQNKCQVRTTPRNYSYTVLCKWDQSHNICTFHDIPCCIHTRSAVGSSLQWEGLKSRRSVTRHLVVSIPSQQDFVFLADTPWTDSKCTQPRGQHVWHAQEELPESVEWLHKLSAFEQTCCVNTCCSTQPIIHSNYKLLQDLHVTVFNCWWVLA